MQTQTVLILKGLPASGKSTYARELVKKHPDTWKRVSKDDLRAMIDNGANSRAREKFICQARDALIVAALAAGYSVVVDDTNLNPVHEQTIRALVSVSPNVRVEVNDTFLEVSVEECIARDSKRQSYVGERVIKRMYNEWLRPAPPAPPKYNPDLPDAILCDLDGTLALLNGRDALREQANCHEDDLDPVVYRLITNELKASGNRTCIILLSGRSAQYRPQTEQWLAMNEVPYTMLLMRAASDQRKDSIVKRELYDRCVAGRFNVLYVIDDRNQVVNMWRNELGYKTLQAAEGDF